MPVLFLLEFLKVFGCLYTLPFGTFLTLVFKASKLYSSELRHEAIREDQFNTLHAFPVSGSTFIGNEVTSILSLMASTQ